MTIHFLQRISRQCGHLVGNPNLYNSLKINPVYTAIHAKTRKMKTVVAVSFSYLYHDHLVVKLLNNNSFPSLSESEQLYRNSNCDTFLCRSLNHEI